MATTQLVSIDAIRLTHRIREDLGDLETLKNSLREYGLFNPVLVDSEYTLIAGERRLRAARELGWKQIEVRVLDNFDGVALLDVEVHENLLRKDFTEAEVAKSIEEKKRRLHPPWYVRLRNWWVRWKRRLFSKRVASRRVRAPSAPSLKSQVTQSRARP